MVPTQDSLNHRSPSLSISYLQFIPKSSKRLRWRRSRQSFRLLHRGTLDLYQPLTIFGSIKKETLKHL